MNPYQIPMQLCQWCYKKVGDCILDCLCLVCKPCFQIKKNWYSQPGKCFCCDRDTKRKWLDLKLNPQKGSIFFQTGNDIITNTARAIQFQQQLAKKYCKHLETKVQKYQRAISSFISQYPQWKSYFQRYFSQGEKKQKSSVRSKSMQSQASKEQQSKILLASNSQRNFSYNNPQANYAVIQNSSNASKNQYIDRSHMYNKTSKQSNSSAYNLMGNNNYVKQGNIDQDFMSKKSNNLSNYEDLRSKKSIQSNSNYFLNQQYQNNNMINRPTQKRNVQGPNMNYIGVTQINKVKQHQKLSDPIQKNMGTMNMQTALRSIRSDDQKNEKSLPRNGIDSRKKDFDPYDQFQFGVQKRSMAQQSEGIKRHFNFQERRNQK